MIAKSRINDYIQDFDVLSQGIFDVHELHYYKIKAWDRRGWGRGNQPSLSAL